MNLLCDLVLEVNKLDRTQGAESKARPEFHKIIIDFMGSMRLRIDLRIGHFDVETAPRPP